MRLVLVEYKLHVFEIESSNRLYWPAHWKNSLFMGLFFLCKLQMW